MREHQSGDYIPKYTKKEILSFIQRFNLDHGKYPTADDIAAKLNRSRSIVAQFLSRYARYGIVDAFKRHGEKTRYGPGVNWEKVDHLEWRDFFKAGKCKFCGHNGVLGFITPNIIRYRCKWCGHVWDQDREWVDKNILNSIELQAQKTRRQWAKS